MTVKTLVKWIIDELKCDLLEAQDVLETSANYCYEELTDSVYEADVFRVINEVAKRRAN